MYRQAAHAIAHADSKPLSQTVRSKRTSIYTCTTAMSIDIRLFARPCAVEKSTYTRAEEAACMATPVFHAAGNSLSPSTRTDKHKPANMASAALLLSYVVRPSQACPTPTTLCVNCTDLTLYADDDAKRPCLAAVPAKATCGKLIRDCTLVTRGLVLRCGCKAHTRRSFAQ